MVKLATYEALAKETEVIIAMCTKSVAAAFMVRLMTEGEN